MAKLVEMPKLGFDMAEGTLVNWVKAEGEKIEKGEALAEIETDKATIQVESAFSGVVYKHLVPANTTLPIGSPIAVIADPDEEVNLQELLGENAPPEEKAAPAGSEPEKIEPEGAEGFQTETLAQDEKKGEEPVEPSSDFLRASPVAKSMAAQNAIDLKAISGSGPGGRIVKRDVEKAIHSGGKTVPSRQTIEVMLGKDERVPLSRLRAAIGKRMTESSQNIPSFTITHNYDVGALLSMRKQMNNDLKDDIKLSVNDFIIHAVALALRQFPNINASLNGDEILRHGNINIGVAVSLESGLLTVVIHSADQKSLEQIARESGDLAQRAREGKLRNEDVQGSTFTISNLGMYAVEDFVAIINPPEAAILAVGSAQQAPVVVDGQLQVGMRMKATLSADHRITDGAEAALFMQHLGLYLEQPWRLA